MGITHAESVAATTEPRAPVRTWTERLRLSAESQRVVVIWLVSRVAVFVLAAYSTWILAGDPLIHEASDAESVPVLGPIATWNRFDVQWYAGIAVHGYGAPGLENNFAFLPGLPWLMGLLGKVPLLNIHPTLAALLISLLAGLVAALALARLTRQKGGRGDLGVLVWVLAPTAVFLAAPYTEAAFCAFAFWAWLKAKDGAWIWASVLAAGATLIRVNGLFLWAGLVVMFLTSRRRRWRDAPFLALPIAALLGVLTWFHSMTGSWTVWLDAQRAGWAREFTHPAESFWATLKAAFWQGQTATYNVQFKMEVASMLVIVVFAVIMLSKRWWGEATYLLVTAAALGTSSVYLSVPRATLVLFPIWVLIALWVTRWKAGLVVYVMLAAPFMAAGVIGFVNGRWIA